MKIRLKEVKVVQRQPFRTKFLNLYYKHLAQLIRDHVSKRISSGRLGRSRWPRYAYYRTWLAGAYGSDRRRKRLGSRLPIPHAVERFRLQALSRRVDRFAAHPRVRRELESLVSKANEIKNEEARTRFVHSYLRNREDSLLAQWLAYTPVGRRVLAGVERDLQRLASYHQAVLQTRQRLPKREELVKQLQQGRAPVVKGWKFAVQTGLLATAWKYATLKIKNGEGYIIPMERWDRLPNGKSLSRVLYNTLRHSGQDPRFITGAVFSRLSKRAVELAMDELGLKRRS